MGVLQEETYTNCRPSDPTLLSGCRLIPSLSGEDYLTQKTFFQEMYNAPGAGASNPNYDLNLLGKHAATRCTIFSAQSDK